MFHDMAHWNLRAGIVAKITRTRSLPKLIARARVKLPGGVKFNI